MHAVPSCSPNVHEDFADSSHWYGSSFYIGTAKKRNKFHYVCTDRMSNRCPVYEDEQNGLVMSKQEDDYLYASGRTGNQHRFRTKEDPRFDGAHHWEQFSKRGWISFGEYLTTQAATYIRTSSKLSKKVKLSNLPPDMTLDELRATAEDFGQVVAVKISRGLIDGGLTGIVEYQSADDMKKAMTKLDNRRVEGLEKRFKTEVYDS